MADRVVWNNGFELHVCIGIPQAEEAPGTVHATVDLGEIHLAAVTTNTGLSRSRSSRADTPQCCLNKAEDQPRLAETVSSETGHTSDVAEKPVSL
ncbi:MAG: hypothetical protein M3Z08_15870 [Chloroflexota bacterium]|nr:hypothetical protein [Chloroflexota bacterium]